MTGISTSISRTKRGRPPGLQFSAEDAPSKQLSTLTPEVQKLLSGSYDSVLVCDLYHLGRDSNLIFELMMPLIIIVMRRHYLGVGRMAEDELVTDAMGGLYTALRKRVYDAKFVDHRHFTAYFWNIIRRELSDTLGAYHRLHHPPTTIEVEHPRMIQPQEVENHIYLEQLPVFVRDIVIKQIRFSGRELQACLYVLDRILTGARIVLAYMKRLIGVSDPEFFVSYIVVKIRMTIYELKLRGGTLVFRDVFSDRYAFEQ